MFNIVHSLITVLFFTDKMSIFSNKKIHYEKLFTLKANLLNVINL